MIQTQMKVNSRSQLACRKTVEIKITLTRLSFSYMPSSVAINEDWWQSNMYWDVRGIKSSRGVNGDRKLGNKIGMIVNEAIGICTTSLDG